MPNPSRRIAVARIWHEANSFNPLLTTLDDFRRREWTRGPAALEAARGTATELGGLVRFLDKHPHWDVTVSRCTSAPPLGPVSRPALDAITQEILADLADGPWDGIYVSLHGAMVAEGDLAPDYTFLREIRRGIGPEPLLAVSFDMHACLDPSVTDVADILAGYHSYPHVDMEETALRALRAMERAFESAERPRVSMRALDFMPLSHGMRTNSGPMAEMVALAQQECANGGFEDISVFGGFTYADTPNTRAALTVTHRPGLTTSGALDRLGTAYTDRRGDFAVSLPGPEQATTDAIAALDQGATWPIALVDTADNPLSGGLGDTTGLLQALIAAKTDYPVVFCFFFDPDLVERAHGLGEGMAISCQLGGRILPDFGSPVPFDGVVDRLTQGRFRNRGPMEFGREIDLGRTAVLRSGSIRVVISETCQSANDPAWCDLHGIELSDIAIFAIKAKNHFRAGFEDLCGSIVELDAPGLAPANRAALPYRHLSLPLES